MLRLRIRRQQSWRSQLDLLLIEMGYADSEKPMESTEE